MATPNWNNRTLFHADNLDVLRNMNSGTVDLIATDPPFNKSKDFHATPESLAKGARFQDRWTWADVHEEWEDTIDNDNPALAEAIESGRFAHSEGMGAYMCFMSVRLMEMRRVLKPTGSLFLHCDPTASHYLKACLDAIFGRKQFRNDIAWCYGGRGAKAIAKRFGRNKDVILFYTRGREYTFNRQFVAHVYSRREARNKGFRLDENGKWFKTSPRGDYTDESIRRLKAEGRIYVTRNGKIRIKYFLESHKGGGVIEQKLVGDTWLDIPDAMHMPKKERMGYPTQKPLKLYERIIKVSSNEGDIVLDPFAGCATTCVAAEGLNRQWIGIDIWPKAHEVVLERFRRMGYSINGEADFNAGMFSFGDVGYTRTLPVRTDEGERAGAKLQALWERAKEPWQKLTNRQMKEQLAQWQSYGSGQELVNCAGCGRQLEFEFMELDHKAPRSEGGSNFIDNRILLCAPCNRTKSDTLALKGLMNRNKKIGWMQSQERAKAAQVNVLSGVTNLKREANRPL